MIANAFTAPRLCMLTGEIKPLATMTQSRRDNALNGKTAAEKTRIVLSQDYNHINIPSQESSDESRRKAGRRINH